MSLVPIIELAAQLFLNFNIQTLIPRPHFSEASSLASGIYRSFAFSNEPTTLASYILAMGGLSLYYASYLNKKTFFLTLSLYLLSLLSTFSSGAFASLLLSLLFVSAYFVITSIFTLRIRIILITPLILSIFLSILVVLFASEFATVSKILEFSQGVDRGRLGFWIFAFSQSISNFFYPLDLVLLDQLILL